MPTTLLAPPSTPSSAPFAPVEPAPEAVHLAPPVGARFPRRITADWPPDVREATFRIRVHPVGARFPRRTAAEAAERADVSWAVAPTGHPVGARFPRRRPRG